MEDLREPTADKLTDRAEILRGALQLGDSESEVMWLSQLEELVENYRMTLLAYKLGVLKVENDDAFSE